MSFSKNLQMIELHAPGNIGSIDIPDWRKKKNPAAKGKSKKTAKSVIKKPAKPAKK